mgnify:CR=1 FL=1
MDLAAIYMKSLPLSFERPVAVTGRVEVRWKRGSILVGEPC